MSEDRFNYGKFALDYVHHICKTYGPRPATSRSEEMATDDIENFLKKRCDQTFKQKFTAIPGLYPQGQIKLLAGFFLSGILFFPTKVPFNLMCFVLGLFGVFILLSSLIYMKEWFGLKIFGFKHLESSNVFGKILPKDENGSKKEGKVKVIIGGHTDSAFQMKIVRFGDNVAKYTFAALGYIVITILLTILKAIITPSFPSIIISESSIFTISIVDIIWFIVSIPGLPFVGFIIYCYTGKIPVMGANDNLSGTGVAVAIAEYFSKPENSLKNVEIWVGSFGSEECGERGSCAFVKYHGSRGELDNSYTIIPESCGAGSHLAILTDEKMHLAHHSPEVYNRLWNAYKKIEQDKRIPDLLPCKVAALPFAASDAGRFSLKGYRASTILAYDGALMKPANWHATSDVPENLDEKNLQIVFEMIKEFILELEKN